MKIISLKTDTVLAEVALWEDSNLITEEKWEAHRQLADTIHVKLADLLKSNSLKWSDIGGIVVFKGPGSFTGLRIGVSVANAIAYSLSIPIIAGMGETWAKMAIKKLLNGENDKISLPEYGGEANITLPKK